MNNIFIIGNTYNIEWPIKLTEDYNTPEESEKFQKWIVGTNIVGGIYKIIDDFNMVTAHGHNIFCDDTIPIPPDAIFKELTASQKNYFLRDPNPMPAFLNEEDDNYLEQKNWVESIGNEFGLTINDVLKLQKGDVLKVLIMDRNLYDVTETSNKGNTLYDPKDFFKDNTAIYTHDKDFKGTIKYGWQTENENALDFEFHIEYKKDCWYPLYNGVIPGEGRFLDAPVNQKIGNNNTRLGWRGPMILWDKIFSPNIPKVYWYEK